MGDKNAVCPLAKKINGEIPKKVVIVVSRMGRIRTRPASTNASKQLGSLQHAAFLAKSISINESFTTIPVSAKKPNHGKEL